MRLTFDWDDISIGEDRAIAGLLELKKRFEHVFFRVSSSGNGLHFIISTSPYEVIPMEFTEEEVIAHRQDFLDMGLECGGRFRTDMMRREAGTTWGRLFSVKNGVPCGEWTYLEMRNV